MEVVGAKTGAGDVYRIWQQAARGYSELLYMGRRFIPSVAFPGQAGLDEEQIEQQYNHEAISRQVVAGFDVLHRHHAAQQRDPKQRESESQEGRTTTSQAMRRGLGFSLVKRRSTLHDAGYGKY